MTVAPGAPGFEGNAIIYCQGRFDTTNGKTAHGLIRRSHRYRVLSVVDSGCAGQDAAEMLDGQARGIPIFATVEEAVRDAATRGLPATHLVVGVAPEGGRLTPENRTDLAGAIRLGLHIDCGLHDFLNDDPILAALAREHGVVLRDIRKPPTREKLHFFSGKIEEVRSLRVAVLGTDSAVGKRTTAWLLVDALREAGISAEMVGTGQTAWLQGARYSMLLDTMINDFLSGEIEHAVWSAWNEQRPRVVVIEGQGSLMNPAFPGGYEILAAARPHCVVMQHPPTRKEYDDFPGFPLHPLEHQIEAIRVVSGKPVVAVTINHEGLTPDEGRRACAEITATTGLPAMDVLRDGAQALVAALRPVLDAHEAAMGR